MQVLSYLHRATHTRGLHDEDFYPRRHQHQQGQDAVPFHNDLNREKVLDKNGHTDIQFWELGEAMTKEQATEFLVAKRLTEDRPAGRRAAPAKQKPDTAARKRDEAMLAKLAQGEVAYDEESDSFQKILAEKRQAFPSHSDEQIREIAQFQAQCNQKAFGAAEPTF